MKGVEVPSGFDNDGEIVLNLSPGAVSNLHMGNEIVSFIGGFKGVKHTLVIPIQAVRAVYSRETGQGMIFDELEPDSEEPVFAPTEEAATVPKPSFLRLVK
jgi:stringent starvation protein B